MPTISLPDLVIDSKLETVVQHDCVRHTFRRRGRAGQDWKVEVAETWTRERRLGRGTYGTVWLEECQEPASNHGPRVRAVKEIGIAAGSKVVDCSRELLAIAKFSAPKYIPCFVQSYGWFETPEAIYITMEYLEHGDLLKHLVQPLPEDEARTIGRQVLEGLKFMHENGFVHRDLKPQNILVVSPGPAWRVQISDFGISRRLEEGTTVTMRQGTLGFMAPELLGFIRAGSSPYAVDMWSLGALLFFVLTQTVFMKDLHRLRDFANGVLATADAETKALGGLGVSNQCSEFLLCLLAPSPDDRPSSQAAAENTWLAISSAGIHRGIPSYGANESARTAVLGTVLTTEFSTQASAAWSSTAGNARTAILETVSAPEPSIDASAASSSTEVTAGPQLDSLPSPSTPPNSIADPVIFWEAKPGTKVSRLLASASEDRTVRIWDLGTGQCRETLGAYHKPSAAVHAVSVTFFRPDMLMWASEKGVTLWDLKNGASEQWLGSFSNTKSRLSPIFSPNSQKLAHLQNKTFFRPVMTSNAVHIYDLVLHRPAWVLKGHLDRISSMAFSPNSRGFASGSYDRAVKIWNLTTGQCAQTLEGHVGPVIAVAFSPDGRLIVSASADGTIKIWSLAEGRCRHTLHDNSRGPPMVLDKFLAFSHDSRLLVSVSSTNITIWDPVTVQSLQTFEHHIRRVRLDSIALSADLSTLALPRWDDTIVIWDLTRGKRLGELKGHTGTIHSVAFSWDTR